MIAPVTVFCRTCDRSRLGQWRSSQDARGRASTTFEEILNPEDAAPPSIFDSLFAWAMLSLLALALLKFLPHFFWYRAFRSGRASHPRPLSGGPSLANWQPEPNTQTPEEINAERFVAYRMSGAVLTASCLIGGIILLALGLIEMPGFKISLGDAGSTTENAAPGIGAIIFGFFVWRQVRK